MLYIGPWKLESRVLLAPMAGVTDPVFRRLCVRSGAALAASEMLSSDTLLYASAKSRHRLERPSLAVPHAVQLAGSEPVQLAAAARYNVEAGADIIDINMGCPAKKVLKRAAGSALLSEPKRVQAILEAVVKAVDVPVTLKIRTGPDRNNRNGVDIARIAEQAGIVCLAVHGRTRADRFMGEAEYETIARIKQAVRIPLIANGDIDTVEKAKLVLQQTDADGIMIGRAAQGNPWFFRELNSALSGERVPERPDLQERHDTLREHLSGLYRLYGSYRGVRIARKHIAWYCKGLPHATAFREQVNTVDCDQQQSELVARFFSAPEQFAVAA